MLINWLLYPLLLAALAAGHGLLIRRLAGGPSALLLLPVGYASMVVWSTMAMATRLHGVAWLALVVPAVTGYALARPTIADWRRRPRWDVRWPLFCGLAAFAIFAAPVVLSGESTLTGYSMITDFSNHFDLTAQLMQSGRVHPAVVDSSFAESVRKLLDANYPIGMHSLLGASAELLGRDLAWLYQPTIAFAGPMAALAAYGVLSRLGLPTLLRAIAAVIVVQPNLLFAYGMEAGFKELLGAAMILITLAVLLEAYETRDRRLIVAAVPVAAGVDVFTVSIAPWMGLILLTLFVATLLRPGPISRVFVVGRWVIFAGLTAALAWPLFPSIQTSVGSGRSSGITELVTSTTDIGNLAAPLDWLTSIGIWLTGDYRFPLRSDVGLTHALIYVVMAAAVLGVASFGWRRRPEIVAVAAAAIVTLIVIPPRYGPWIDAKVYAVTGVFCLISAFCGVAALTGHRYTRPFAWLLALVVSGGVLYGNALAVHSTTIAPEARLHELEAIGHRYSGQGPALFPSFDEYAEYFLRNVKATGRVNPPNGFPGDPPQFGADLDQVDPKFVRSFPLLILRRNPTRSRPPSDYRLVERTRFYEVWRRNPGPTRVDGHVALARTLAERSISYCRQIGTLSKFSSSFRLRWALANDPAVWIPTEGTWTPGWQPDPAGSALFTRGPGHADGTVRLARAGRYHLWLTGSFERPVQVLLDGRRIATIGSLPDYADEAVPVTVLNLDSGAHRVQIRRGGGSLRPGNGDATGSRFVGPLIFLREGDPGGSTFETPSAAAYRVCRSQRSLDWVEVIKPASS